MNLKGEMSVVDNNILCGWHSWLAQNEFSFSPFFTSFLFKNEGEGEECATEAKID
ncbi:unnamed protein product [Meloidogyne enterolobii]|uniref:Uncharacterized protein n=1 Tax=Meloidogyne enterolobii TaxID=390850 RepID=A0ACB1B3V7_MELEN